MKKTILSLCVCMAYSFSMQAQFNVVPPATFSTVTGIYDMVPTTLATCSNMIAGAIWKPTTVDFSKSFTVDFEAKFTPINGVGADGIVLVFGSRIDITAGTTGSVGSPGGNMGYYGGDPEFEKSIGVEFDIHNNGSPKNDIAQDHVNIGLDGNNFSAFTTPQAINPPGGVDNGTWNWYKVTWDCSTREMHVYFNPGVFGISILSATLNPLHIFDNPGNVKWGFTAGKGGDCSRHEIRNINMTVGGNCQDADECMDPEVEIIGFGTGCSFLYRAYPGEYGGTQAKNWIWDFGDGSPLDYTSGWEVSHTYASGVPANPKVTIIGYNSETGCCAKTIDLGGGCVMPGGGLGGGPVPAGINENNSTGRNMIIAPNPTTGEFAISLPGKAIQQIRIYDVSGRNVYTNAIQAPAEGRHMINLSGVANGLYMVEVTDEHGVSHKNKIIINK